MNIKPDGHDHSFIKNTCQSSRGLQFDCQQFTANVTEVTGNPILGLYKQLHLCASLTCRETYMHIIIIKNYKS